MITQRTQRGKQLISVINEQGIYSIHRQGWQQSISILLVLLWEPNRTVIKAYQNY